MRIGKRQLRAKMHAENPNCHYCNEKTNLKSFRNDPLLATIEHLYNKLHPKRYEPNNTGERRLVIACLACNSKKGQQDTETLVTREEWRLRSMGKRNWEGWAKARLRDLDTFDCF